MALRPVWTINGGRFMASGLRLRWSRLLELLLIAALVVQAARLVWIVVTPVGPLGDWRGKAAAILPPERRAELFRSFDAFYPSPVVAGPAVQNVTSLALTLHGVRINEGSGLGSAIIAGADGDQESYAVGDEIQPGVTLKTVLFDHVVIDRGGAEETIFLDQSRPVDPVVPSASGNPASSSEGLPAPPPGGTSAEELKAGIGLGPRISNGRVTGLIVTRKGPGFATAGFRDGDVITQINGRPVGAADDLAALQQGLVPGARLSLMVERGADTVPIAIIVQGT